MRKGFLAMFLSICMILTLFPAAVYADDGAGAAITEEPSQDSDVNCLRIGGIDIDTTSISYWKLDAEGKPTEPASAYGYDLKIKGNEVTLKLGGSKLKGDSNDAAHYGAAIYAKGDLILNVEYDSKVQGADINSNRSAGVYIEDGSLTVKGSGTLIAAGGSANGEDAIARGIFVYGNDRNAALIVDEGKVESTGDDVGIQVSSVNGDTAVVVKNQGMIHGISNSVRDAGAGINVSSYETGNVSLSVESGGIMKGTAISNEDLDSAGIYTRSETGSMTATVEGNGSVMEGTGYYYGIYVSSGTQESSLIVRDNGVVRGQGNNMNYDDIDYSYGVYVNSDTGNVSATAINGGSIKGTAGSAKQDSTGITVWSDNGDSQLMAQDGGIVEGIGSCGDFYSDGIYICSYDFGGASIISENGSSITGLSGNSKYSNGIYICSNQRDAVVSVINSRLDGISNYEAFSNAGIYVWAEKGGKGLVTVDGGVLTAKGKDVGLEYSTAQEDTVIGELTIKNNGTTNFEGEEKIFAIDVFLFENNEDGSSKGKLYSDEVTVFQSIEIPKGYDLDIAEGQTLTVGKDQQMTVNGSVENEGTFSIYVYDENAVHGEGTLTGDGEFVIQYAYPQVTVPERMAYTGEDLSGNIQIAEPVDEAVFMGKEFQILTKLNEKNWTRTITKDGNPTDVIVEPGVYEITYTCKRGETEHIITKTTVVEKDLGSGAEDATVSSEANATRGMVVNALWRMAGSPAADNGITFSDIDESTYYSEAACWAASAGVTSGYTNGTFGGNNEITREQFAVMLYHYAKLKGYDVSIGENTNILSYTDAFDISEYAFSAMQWACGADLMADMGDGSIAPKSCITAAEAEQILKDFQEKFVNE